MPCTQKFIQYIATLTVSLTVAAAATAQSVDPLGDLPGGATFSIAYGVSGDGTVVVGGTASAAGFEAFRWTQTSGIAGIGDLAGGAFSSTAYATSQDGSVVVGRGVSAAGTEAFRWTQAGGMVAIGDLAGGGFSSTALDVNNDGTVIVGISSSANGSEAFRWTQAGGMVGLGGLLLGGTFYSEAFAVSGDGATVVGHSRSAASGIGTEAFRWTQGSGMVGLGDLAGGVFQSRAHDVNTNGSVIVGYGNSASGREAFRWTQAGGMIGLGDLAGGAFDSQANATNADGTVVVGRGTTVTGATAFYWTAADGLQALPDLLTGLGVNLSGILLNVANDVSDDGSVVVGYGDFGSGIEGYIARISGTTGLISLSELNNSLQQVSILTKHANAASFIDAESFATVATRFDFSNRRAQIDQNHSFAPASHLGGPRTRPYRPSSQLVRAFSIGTVFGHTNDEFDARSGRGIAGLGTNLYPGVSAGLGIVSSKSNSDLPYRGSFNEHSFGAGLFIDYRQPAGGLRLTATATGRRLNFDIKRGYLNGATEDISNGETTGTAWSGLLRAGYDIPLPHFATLTPFAEFAATRSKISAFTESGGAFPVDFNNMSEVAKRIRIGAELRAPVTDNIEAWTWAAWNKRLEDDSNDISGTVQGLFEFNLESDPHDSNGGDAGMGAKWQISPDIETLATIATSFSNDLEPEVTGRLGANIKLGALY